MNPPMLGADLPHQKGQANTREKRPTGRGWFGPLPNPITPGGTLAISRWQNGLTIAISELAWGELPSGGAAGPQWHLSISVNGRRARGHEVRQVLRDFGFPADAEEDNHHPGLARHFWEPLDPAARAACQCKETEDVIREADGYTWTNPTPATGEECRGCEYGRLFGKPCAIHAA